MNSKKKFCAHHSLSEILLIIQIMTIKKNKRTIYKLGYDLRSNQTIFHSFCAHKQTSNQSNSES